MRQRAAVLALVLENSLKVISVNSLHVHHSIVRRLKSCSSLCGRIHVVGCRAKYSHCGPSALDHAAFGACSDTHAAFLRRQYQDLTRSRPGRSSSLVRRFRLWRFETEDTFELSLTRLAERTTTFGHVASCRVYIRRCCLPLPPCLPPVNTTHQEHAVRVVSANHTATMLWHCA